jgi:hypothetical protein
MSDFYNSQRSRNLYEPGKAFKISRSKIDLFLSCPRCFYLDRRLGVGRPPGFPFNLNSAVDFLLKKEFDIHRANGTAHPLMEAYGLKAVPWVDSRMNEWRENFKGVTALHQPTNLTITGAVDDIWINPQGELIIVDYKSTAKDGEVNIDADWQISYKRQMEIYQWLVRQNGLSVSDTGYFVYCNGVTDCQAFDARLEFEVKLIPYQGNDKWVEGTILDLYNCLHQEEIPPAAHDCDYCSYRRTARKYENS